MYLSISQLVFPARNNYHSQNYWWVGVLFFNINLDKTVHERFSMPLPQPTARTSHLHLLDPL